MNYTLRPLGDHAVVIQLGESIEQNTHEKVKQVTAYFEKSSIEWLIELVPAFTTVTLFYDPIKALGFTQSRLPYEAVCEDIKRSLAEVKDGQATESRIVEIPVCYGGEFGPDLQEVAKYHGISEKEVIEKHTSGDYLVYMIGFAPGFPYIGGMSSDIATPRKESPRLNIPAGSVGIAGKQTGVYPIETPGGWQLIGRTPLKLFQPEKESPSLLEAGDRIRFKEITLKEYKELEEE